MATKTTQMTATKVALAATEGGGGEEEGGGNSGPYCSGLLGGEKY